MLVGSPTRGMGFWCEGACCSGRSRQKPAGTLGGVELWWCGGVMVMCLWCTDFPATPFWPWRVRHLAVAALSRPCTSPCAAFALGLAVALALAFALASALLVRGPRFVGLLWGRSSCRGHRHGLTPVCLRDRCCSFAQEVDSLQVRCRVHVGGVTFFTSSCSLGYEAVMVGAPLVVLGLGPALSAVVVPRVRGPVEAAIAPHDGRRPLGDRRVAQGG